jgi:hypothetical protein
VIEVSKRNVSEIVLKRSNNYPVFLRRLSFFELLEEEDQLTECAEQVARAWVVAKFTLCYHEAGVNSPQIFHPLGGVVHGEKCFDVLNVERGRILEFGRCLSVHKTRIYWDKNVKMPCLRCPALV